MGHDGPLYQMAQWYPRVAVYDDVKGWNHDPYIGAGEFYLEYGSFDVTLTVPAEDIVAATGALQNPEQVLTPTQRQRLTLARHSDTTNAIITAQERQALAPVPTSHHRLPATGTLPPTTLGTSHSPPDRIFAGTRAASTASSSIRSSTPPWTHCIVWGRMESHFN